MNANYNFIIDYLNYKNKVNDRFNLWLSHKKDYESHLKIHPRDLNERFLLLKKTFNSHCKVNYIDFNCVVDQILQMSLPYCETKSNNVNKKHVVNTQNQNSATTFKGNKNYAIDNNNTNVPYNNTNFENSLKNINPTPDMSPISNDDQKKKECKIKNKIN